MLPFTIWEGGGKKEEMAGTVFEPYNSTDILPPL